MTRVFGLDGRAYEIDDQMLAARQLKQEQLGKLMQSDDLPDAPPPGSLPLRMHEFPMPEEARGLVRARAYEDGRLVIDVNVAALMGGRGSPPPNAQQGACSTGSCGSNPGACDVS